MTDTERRIDRSRPQLTARLEHIRAGLRRRLLAQSCIVALALVCAGVMLLDGWNRLISLQEHTAFWTLVLVLCAAAVLLVWNWFRAVFRAPTSVELALEVERGHPEFLDSLICAAELSRRDRDSLRPLERALLEKVERDIADGGAVEDVFRERLRWRRLAVPAFLFAAAAALLMQSAPVVKARLYASDLVRGTTTGLTVYGPEAPVPVHSDVQIRAEVKRWEDEAQIAYEDADGRQRFPMNRRADRHYFFTLYDVSGPIRYRVETPSLVSEWHVVETYTPPEFDEIEMRLISPAYTGREPATYPEFRSGSLVEGGRLEVLVRSAPDVTATFVQNGAAEPMIKAPDGAMRFARELTETIVFNVRLTTPEGWTATGPETTVTVEPDLPPVVDITQPRQDTQVKLNENVELDVRAGDDFGVRDIVLDYSVSGGPRQAVRLFAAGNERTTEHSLVHLWDLGALGVKEGDVISYAVVVSDNRVPTPQTARTDVYFIVVRPNVEPKESEGEGEQQELDISGIIAELKRLIRYSWDVLSAQADRQGDMTEDLARDLKDLRVELRRKFNEAVEAAGGMMPGDIPRFFQGADNELGQAILLADRALVEESLPPQERALANLVALENELLKNAAKGKGKSKSDQQSDSDQQQQNQQDAQSQAQQRRQKIEEMKKALDRARELSERQDSQNRDVEREGNSIDPQTAAALADKQQQIGKEANALKKGIEPLQEAQRAARDLQAAEREMGRAADQLANDSSSNAGRHGARAHNFLLSAIQSLEDGLRRASANEIQRLAQAAQALSDAQRSEAEQSRQMQQMNTPPDAQVDAARRRQDSLQEQAGALQTAISRAAGELEQDFPDASRALVEAGNAARDAGTERSMKRAANALLYRRFDRARTEQVDAANALQQLASNLGKASRFLPSMSREELLEAIQRMRERAREAADLMESTSEEASEQLESLRERAAREMDRLSAQSQDQALQQLADDMSLPMGGENPAAVGRRLVGMFNAAIAVLEQHLMATELKRRVGLSRQQATPPEKYRRLVEQYFKDLSREQ